MIKNKLSEILGRKRGCLMSGGRVDTQKASKIFLDELKAGKIGNARVQMYQGRYILKGVGVDLSQLPKEEA